MQINVMKTSNIFSILVVVVVGLFVSTGISASPTPTPTPTPAQTPTAGGGQSESGYAVLLGRWVRPDGGYMITINGAAADGKLDAAYANPGQLPFSKAEASHDGKTIKLFFELRAGGYNGSTYTLVYDPAMDVLRGVYYQAVAKEKYDIQFQRIGQPPR